MPTIQKTEAEPRTFASHRETLTEIARLVATLPHSGYPSLHLGCSSVEALELLRSIGTAEVNVYERLTQSEIDVAIDVAVATIGGLEIRTQRSREATPEETAALSGADVLQMNDRSQRVCVVKS